MISLCSKQNVPVVVINGRLSERSYKRYKFAKPLLLSTFRRLVAIGMQNELYAARVRSLGAMNVTVLGTMKWDNAIISDTIDGVDSLAEDLHIDRTKPLVVAGSTAPDEHLLLKDSIPEGVQLLCAPRRPEWFDDAEKTLSPCNRRKSNHREQTNYFLLDTIGELDKAYALADIVVIGRSFAPLHGSDPTSSVALGKPTIIGPNVSDFEEMVEMLVSADAIIQCKADELKRVIQRLLEDQELRSRMRDDGRAVIRTNQGATIRYGEFIVGHTPHA